MKRDSFTVLVVCTGNLNRSALGAALMRRWAEWYLPAPIASQVRVESAGLAAPVGSQMRTRTRLVAEALGGDGSGHLATQITEGMVRAADLVLVAEAAQRDTVLGLAPGALRNTFTIREAGVIAGELPEAEPPATLDDLRARVAALAGHRSLADGAETDIVDPQGKDDEAYREMARQEVPALTRLASTLFGMPAAELLAYDEAVADAAAFPFDGGAAGGGDAGADATPPDGTGRPRGRRQA